MQGPNSCSKDKLCLAPKVLFIARPHQSHRLVCSASSASRVARSVALTSFRVCVCVFAFSAASFDPNLPLLAEADWARFCVHQLRILTNSICNETVVCLTCAAIAAFDRASSLPPCAPGCADSPSVRPGVFFQFALAGTGARG